MIKYINNGPILKSDKIKLLEESIKEIRKIKEETGHKPNFGIFNESEIDVESIVNKQCDYLINKFIEKGLLVVNGYQYLFGTFLSEEILEKCEDNRNIISKVIHFTSEFGKMSLEDVLVSFNMETLFNQSKSSGKCLTKKI